MYSPGVRPSMPRAPIRVGRRRAIGLGLIPARGVGHCDDEHARGRPLIPIDDPGIERRGVGTENDLQQASLELAVDANRRGEHILSAESRELHPCRLRPGPLQHAKSIIPWRHVVDRERAVGLKPNGRVACHSVIGAKLYGGERIRPAATRALRSTAGPSAVRPAAA